MTPIPVKRDEMSRFAHVMFDGCDRLGYVSLRVFKQLDPGPPLDIKPVRLNLGVELVIEEAVRLATKASNGGTPAVFCPPVCTFISSRGAKGSDIHEAPALSVEIDQGDLEKKADALTLILGVRPTFALHSGSTWIDPETGEKFPKGHLHWLLSKPARGPDQLKMLRRARHIATLIVGGDPSAENPVHPLRWPGSLNRKSDPPTMAHIVEENASKIDLAEALASLEDAAQSRNLATPPAVSHHLAKDDLPAEVAQIAEWLSFYPESALPADRSERWHAWNNVAMAVHRATDGSETGFEVFRAWSASDPAHYSEDGCRARWGAITGCPATVIGAYYLRHKAVEHGWTPSPEAEPQPQRQAKPSEPTYAERIVAECAAMDEIDFGQVRKTKAAELGIAPADLNKARSAEKAKIAKAARDVEKARAKADKEKAAAVAEDEQAKARADASDHVARLIAEFNAKYLVVNENGHAVIYAPKFDPILKRRYYERLSFGDFERLYSNRRVQTGKDSGGNPMFRPVAGVWLGAPERKQYIDGIVFDPSGREQSDQVLNLWSGWAVDPAPGNWTELRRHILEVICDGDKQHFEYLLDWMADLVQNPAKQGEVAIVLQGDEGSGKGVLARALKRLFGQHGLAISNAKHLVGNFNAHLRDAVFLFADEAFYAGDRAHIGVLKALITEPYLTIEAKYQNAVQVPNFLHIMMASNESGVVPASLGSRRFFVLAVSNSKIGAHAYFGAIQKQLDEGGHVAMLHDLLNRDISKSNLRNIPVTKALQTQRKMSLDTKQAWWWDCLHRGFVYKSRLGLEDVFGKWHEFMSTDLLYESYSSFCQTRHERHPLARELFGRWMQEVGAKPHRPRNAPIGEHMVDSVTDGRSSRIAEVIQGVQPRGYSLGNLSAARDAYSSASGLSDITWDDADPEGLEEPHAGDPAIPF